MFGNRSEGRVALVLEAVGSVCLVVLMLTVFVDVLGRNLLNKPLPWGTEVLEIVLAAMIFLVYPVLALNFGRITVDLIQTPAPLRKLQQMLGAAMGAVLFALISWCMARQTVRAAGYGDSTPLLQVPIAWVLGSMSVLAAVTAVAFLAALVKAARLPAETRVPLVTEVI